MKSKIVIIGLMLTGMATFAALITLVPIIGKYSLIINLFTLILSVWLLIYANKNAFGKSLAVIVLLFSLASAGVGVWGYFIKKDVPQQVDWQKVDDNLKEKASDNRPKGDSLNKQMDDLENSLGK